MNKPVKNKPFDSTGLTMREINPNTIVSGLSREGSDSDYEYYIRRAVQKAFKSFNKKGRPPWDDEVRAQAILDNYFIACERDYELTGKTRDVNMECYLCGKPIKLSSGARELLDTYVKKDSKLNADPTIRRPAIFSFAKKSEAEKLVDKIKQQDGGVNFDHMGPEAHLGRGIKISYVGNEKAIGPQPGDPYNRNNIQEGLRWRTIVPPDDLRYAGRKTARDAGARWQAVRETAARTEADVWLDPREVRDEKNGNYEDYDYRWARLKEDDHHGRRLKAEAVEWAKRYVDANPKVKWEDLREQIFEHFKPDLERLYHMRYHIAPVHKGCNLKDAEVYGERRHSQTREQVNARWLPASSQRSL